METRQDTSQQDDSPNLASYHIDYGTLKFGKELGRGGFGVVYEGEYDFDKVAIKKLHLHMLSKEHLKEFEREAEVMARLRHPRTVQLYGVCLQAPDYALVMEYMPHGSLGELLSSPKTIPWEQRYQIGLDVGAGVAYLHQHGIVHCDLKSDNVLLDASYRAKVTDFGISRLKSENSTFGTWTAGTLGWMAPELLGDSPKNTKEADVYAYGVVLWELGARKKPFMGLSLFGIAKRVSEGNREPISEDTPSQMAELILDCWKQEPEARPSMPAALKFLREHPVIANEDSVKVSTDPISVIEEKPIISALNQPPQDYSSKNLLEAAKNGRLEAVQWLLAHGASLSEKDNNGSTALLWAAYEGHLEVVKWLLANGASLEEKSNRDTTALLFAAGRGHLEVVKWLLANGASLEEKNAYGHTALLLAAQRGDLEVVKWLLANGASLEEKSNLGMTALLYAVHNRRDLEVVKWLLANGASLEEKSNDGMTALLYAVHNRGCLEVVKWLLANGSSVSEKDNNGRTALLWTAYEGHLEVVKWLLANGSSVSEKDNNGRTALLWAAERGHLEVVKWLLANGSSVSEKDNNGRTALLWTAYEGHLEVVKWLLANGSSVSEKDNNGRTALDLATKSQMKEFLRNYRPIQLSTNTSRFIGNQIPKLAPQQQTPKEPQQNRGDRCMIM